MDTGVSRSDPILVSAPSRPVTAVGTTCNAYFPTITRNLPGYPVAWYCPIIFSTMAAFSARVAPGGGAANAGANAPPLGISSREDAREFLTGTTSDSLANGGSSYVTTNPYASCN